jgi:hypothetical protein
VDRERGWQCNYRICSPVDQWEEQQVNSLGTPTHLFSTQIKFFMFILDPKDKFPKLLFGLSPSKVHPISLH